MHFTSLRGTAIIIVLCLLGSCQKNAAQTAPRNLTSQEKADLFVTIRADTIFKQWTNNQLMIVQAYARAAQQPNFDIQKLQSYKPKNDEELIAAFKEAGATNGEEILALNKTSMQLLKELWKKYPEVNKLSHEELAGLNFKTALKNN